MDLQRTPREMVLLMLPLNLRDADTTVAPAAPRTIRSLPRTPKDDLPSLPLPKSETKEKPTPVTDPESEPETAPEEESTSEDMELPKIGLGIPGRESPYRYVHGAPLHNVLEEEEEE